MSCFGCFSSLGIFVQLWDFCTTIHNDFRHFWKGEWQYFCPWKSFHILQRLNVFKSGVMSRVLARKLSSFSLFTCAGLPRDTG